MTLVCLDCGSNSIDDTDGEVLTSGAEEGHCEWCLRNWLFPRRYDTGSRNWDWRPRDLYDYRALLPLSETRELAAHAPIPDAQENDR